MQRITKKKSYFIMLEIMFIHFTIMAQYVNPLKGDIGVHDPVMIKEKNIYYVFSTGAQIQGKTSTDKITWKNTGYVLNPVPTWFKTIVPKNNGTDCWAPDISYRNNLYWLYYSVSSFGSNVSAIGLATNTTLDPKSSGYQWVDKGVVISSKSTNNYNCIDPNVFLDTDGTVYLIFGSFWSGIKQIELDPVTGKPLSGAAVNAIAARTTNNLGIEAPFLIKYTNYYYLFVSWDLCCKGDSSTYKIVVGRADKATGPFIDATNKTMISGGGTILDTGDMRWKGPGHNGIFFENDTVFCINHVYDKNNNGSPTMQIRPLYWDSNSWPTFKKQPVENRSQGKTPLKLEDSSPKVFLYCPGTFSSKAYERDNKRQSKIYTVNGQNISFSLFQKEKIKTAQIYIIAPGKPFSH